MENYSRFAFWQCRSCADEVPGAVRGILLTLLVLGAVTLLPQLFLTNHGIVYRAAITLRCFLNFAQILLFVTLLHAKWGFSTLVFTEVMRVTGTLGGLLLSEDCQRSHYFQAIALSCYPFLLLTACLALWSLRRLWHGREVFAVAVAAGCTVLDNYWPVLSFVVVPGGTTLSCT